jgi:hypothetical protein
MIYVIGLIAVAIIGFRVLRWIFCIVASLVESVTDREDLGIVSGLIVAVGLGLLGVVLLFDW